MADSSLDDFFAKKDKSKKKSKSKLTPADILEKAGEESKPKKEKKKRDKEKTQSSGSSQNTAKKVEDDEEWLDFQEEAEKDLTGLRIQNLQITKEDEEEQEEEEETEDGEEGESRDKQSTTSGPWIIASGGQPQKQGPGPALGSGTAAVQAAEPAPQPPKPKEEAPKVTGKYIPPGARASLRDGGSSPVVSTQPIRRKKEAPNIKSEEDFPTLGGPSSKPDLEPESSDNYEHPGSKRGVQLSLENKFSALQD